jgi:hypothetical protein
MNKVLRGVFLKFVHDRLGIIQFDIFQISKTQKKNPLELQINFR